MTEKICCFTGHRNIPDSIALKLSAALDSEIEARIADGYTVFRAGGALGFDTMAALRVLLKKKKYGFIKLELCLPCKDQDKRWKEHEKHIYRYILSLADSVRYVGDSYTDGCMLRRNRMLVDGSDCCIAFCMPESSKGGTIYTVRYAAKKGVERKNLFYFLK